MTSAQFGSTVLSSIYIIYIYFKKSYSNVEDPVSACKGWSGSCGGGPGGMAITAVPLAFISGTTPLFKNFLMLLIEIGKGK